jgi:hypothetical protein
LTLQTEAKPVEERGEWQRPSCVASPQPAPGNAQLTNAGWARERRNARVPDSVAVQVRTARILPHHSPSSPEVRQAQLQLLPGFVASDVIGGRASFILEEEKPSLC